MLFRMVAPRVYITSTMRPTVDKQTVRLLWDKFWQDRVAALLQDVTLRPGPHSTGYEPIQAQHSAHTTAEERTHVNKAGATHGCHTCGSTDPSGSATYGKWIADHQPPKSLELDRALLTFDTVALKALELKLTAAAPRLKEVLDSFDGMGGIRLYPHCGECSLYQSGCIGKLNKLRTQIMAARKKAHLPQGPVEIEELYTKLNVVLEEGIRRKIIRLDHVAGDSTTGTLRPANAIEKEAVQKIGGNTSDATKGKGIGCHSCGETDPKKKAKFIADHQPPTALFRSGLRRDQKQFLYPQCTDCSSKQSAVTNKVNVEFDFLHFE